MLIPSHASLHFEMRKEEYDLFSSRLYISIEVDLESEVERERKLIHVYKYNFKSDGQLSFLEDAMVS